MTTPARSLITSPRVLVIAHRGASSTHPENTLAAFLAGIEAGADLIELDYQHSADDVPVVIHDPTLDRTTSAPRVFQARDVPVASKTVDELRKLDAGSWFDPRFAGTALPTLVEAITLIAGRSVPLIERKSGSAATCAELLRRRDLLDRVVVQSMDWEFLRACRELAPELALAAVGKRELTADRLAEAAEIGVLAIAWKHDALQAADVERIHDRGMRAWAWTVDDAGRAEELIRGGIDGLITNRPAEMRRLVDAHDSAG